MANGVYIQRVHVVIEVATEQTQDNPMYFHIPITEDINPKKNWRDETGITAAMGRLAKEIRKGNFMYKGMKSFELHA